MNHTLIANSVLVALFFTFPVVLSNEISTVKRQKCADTELGLSSTHPIVITEKSIEKAENFAKKHIKENYPEYKIKAICMMDNMNNGHSTQTYTLQKTDKDNPENKKTVKLYFDVEIAMSEFRKKNAKEIQERLKKIEIIQQ